MRIRVNEFKFNSNGKSGEYFFKHEEYKNDEDVKRIFLHLKFSPVEMQYRLDVLMDDGTPYETVYTVNPALFDYPIKEPETIYSTGAKSEQIHKLILFILSNPLLASMLKNTFEYVKLNESQLDSDIFSILFSNSVSQFNTEFTISDYEVYKKDFYQAMKQMYLKWKS